MGITFRPDLSAIPVSPPASRWLATMRGIFPDAQVNLVLIYAETIKAKRHGRQVTKADLEAALDELAAERANQQ